MKKIINKFKNVSGFIVMGIIYKALWKKGGIVKKYIYMILPFIILILFYSIAYTSGALFYNEGLPLTLDYTNMLMIPYILLFGYYISGWLYVYSDKVIRELQEKVSCSEVVYKNLNLVNTIYKIAQLCLYFIPLLSLFFINVADMNGTLNWYSCLSAEEFIFYKILIGIAWYLSACLVIIAVFSVIKLHIIIKNIKLAEISVFDSDYNCGFSKTNKMNVIFLGISLYYILAACVIFVSDYNASEYVENALYKYPWILFIVILVFVMYILIIIIPLIESVMVVKQAIDEEKSKMLANGDEVDNISKIKIFPITINMMGVFLSVWIIPLLMLIFTAYAALK